MPTHASRQRGVAALVVTMTLFFAMLFVAVYANRNLVFEQRASANQYRATQAFEAAEAGLEWAQAQLNSTARIGEDCKPGAAEPALAFRERYLGANGAAGFGTVTWNNAGVAAQLQAACVRRAAGWSCACPSAGHPVLAAGAEERAGSAFAVEFLPGGQSGVVRVVSRGCSNLGGACAPGSGNPTDATARVEVALALLPGLASAPAAALTVRGSVDVGGAALTVSNADVQSGALAVHAGAGVHAPAARFGGAAGAAQHGAVAGNDAMLAALRPDQVFTAYFGLERSRWSAQPAVTTLSCSGNCAADLQRAIASAGTNALVRVSSDAQIDGPVTLGSPRHPALIVVDGSARLNGAVTLHGVLYAGAIRWDGPDAAGSVLRGAIVSESSYQGDAAPTITYDAALLALLRTRSGTFARVSGSWRDF